MSCNATVVAVIGGKVVRFALEELIDGTFAYIEIQFPMHLPGEKPPPPIIIRGKTQSLCKRGLIDAMKFNP